MLGCIGAGVVGAKLMTKLSPRSGEIWGLRVLYPAELQLFSPGVLCHFATFRGSIDGLGDYWNLRIRSLGLISTVISRDTVPIIGFP